MTEKNNNDLLAAVVHFNSWCNEKIHLNMLYWEYKPKKDELEFTVYFKRHGANARFDFIWEWAVSNEEQRERFLSELYDYYRWHDEIWAGRKND